MTIISQKYNDNLFLHNMTIYSYKYYDNLFLQIL